MGDQLLPRERRCKCMGCTLPAVPNGKQRCIEHLARYKARRAATQASGLPERQRAAECVKQTRERPENLLRDEIRRLRDRVTSLETAVRRFL